MAVIHTDMDRIKKFSEWLYLREMGPAAPQTKLTPAQQTAQDATTSALQKMPMKPGQKPADLLNDPKGQADLLQAANKQAQQKGKPLNLGAAATAMDAAAAAPQPGM
jgi:hypothetical protein